MISGQGRNAHSPPRPPQQHKAVHLGGDHRGQFGSLFISSSSLLSWKAELASPEGADREITVEERGRFGNVSEKRVI